MSTSSPLPASPAEPISKADPYAAFRHADYRRFFVVRGLFTMGSLMQTAAVGWLLYERLGSVMALAYVGLVQIIPILLLGLPAGHLADHFDRKKIVMVGQILFGFCSVALTIVSFTNVSPYYIYLILFVISLSRILTIPAITAIIPTIVPKETWSNAASWNSTIFELSGLIGPAFAGIVIGKTGGATAVFAATAVMSLVCFFLFSRIKPQQIFATRKSVSIHDFAEGLKFVFRTKLLLAVVSLDLFAVLLGGATALIPAVAKDVLHVGPEEFGWLRAAPAIGAISMAFLSAHLPPWKRAGTVLIFAMLGFGAANVVFGLSTNYWLSMAMLILTGVFDNLNVVIRQTLLQFITPDPMRGRVGSVSFIFIGCSNELGALESGLAARWLGIGSSIVWGGLASMAIVCGISAAYPPLRKIGLLEEIRPAPFNPERKS